MALRLRKVRDGHGWLQKLKLAVFPWVAGFPVPDVVRTLAYRPEYFGNAMAALEQSTLRGESFWTVAERELFAGWVSARNQCAF